MDTHYLFLNKQFQSHVEDDNDILIKDDILKAIIFNGDISGTTAILVDLTNLFGYIALNKINFKSKLAHVKHMNDVGGNIWQQ